MPLALVALSVGAAPAQYLRGVNLAGAEFGDGVLPGVYGRHYTYNSEQTFDYFAARSLNFIRLQVRWERLQPVLGGPLDPVNLGYLKQDIAWAKAAGAVVSIDAHNYGRYRINEQGSLKEYILDNVYNGVVKVSTANLTDFWVRLSNEFKYEPSVLAYDLMNEPHDMGSADWRQISQAVLNAIRGNLDTKLIMIPGNSYSSATAWPNVNGFAGWIVDPANHFYYEAHEYFDHDYSGGYAWSYDQELAANPQLATVGVTRLQPFLNWCRNNSVPCYLGEYGIPNNDARWLGVLDQFLSALDAAGMPGTYWAAGEWWGAYPLSVQPLGDFAIDRPQTRTLLAHLAPGAFTTISAAADFGYAVAPGALVSGYGGGLAGGLQAAANLPLPTKLQDAEVRLTDVNGAITMAPLVLVSPSQINYQAPAGTPTGRVDVTVLRGGTAVASGVLEVRPIAPTIFSANNSGSGIAAAQVVRVKSDGTQSYENVAAYDANQGKFVGAPVNFGADQLVLLLYGTGFDSADAGQTTVSIGATPLSVQYSGAQHQFPGLDQINAPLPPSLAGTAEVTVNVTVGGKAANAVTVLFQ